MIGISPKVFRKRGEEFTPGDLNPLTSLRGLVLSGNLPASREPAKMIDAKDVDRLKRRAKPVDPPTEPGRPHRVPIVKRISPKLPGLAEVIGRNAGYDDRLPVAVELEHLGLCPDISRVAGNEYRRVADDC